MDIVSTPEFTERVVTDLDIMMPGGLIPITLEVEDVLNQTPEGLEITVYKTGEQSFFFQRYIYFVSKRLRTIRTPILKPKPNNVDSVGT